MNKRFVFALAALCVLSFSCGKEKTGTTDGGGSTKDFIKVPTRKVEKWTLAKTEMLFSGLRLSEYSCDTAAQRIWVAVVDLNEPRLTFDCGLAQDIIPNPGGKNGDGKVNKNNGHNLRETLSELCARRRSAGQKILVGVNADFFNTENGVLWGPHIEHGELLFIGNPDAQVASDSKRRGFTFFSDRTVDCGSLRTFSGTVEIGGKQYPLCSVNDTTLRNLHAAWPVNLYSSRYVRYPHAEEAPELENALYPKALYVRFRYRSEPARVNAGWTEAVVTAVYDGRKETHPEPPYLTDPGEWALQLTGGAATEIAGKVADGTVIRLREDILLEGRAVGPIETHVSGAQHYLNAGAIKTTWSDVRDPMTWIACDQTRKKVYVFAADGRQKGWSLGMNRLDLTRFAWQLGCWDLNVLDGGGSTAMWVWRDGGGLVGKPSDKYGERSDLNYLFVKIKDEN